jgi:hypothetical protein
MSKTLKTCGQSPSAESFRSVRSREPRHSPVPYRHYSRHGYIERHYPHAFVVPIEGRVTMSAPIMLP